VGTCVVKVQIITENLDNFVFVYIKIADPGGRTV
jgi:hypothetical protein